MRHQAIRSILLSFITTIIQGERTKLFYDQHLPQNTFDKQNEIHAVEVENSLNLLSKRGRRQRKLELKASKTLQELTSAGRVCSRFMTGLIIPNVMNKMRPM